MSTMVDLYGDGKWSFGNGEDHDHRVTVPAQWLLDAGWSPPTKDGPTQEPT